MPSLFGVFGSRLGRDPLVKGGGKLDPHRVLGLAFGPDQGPCPGRLQPAQLRMEAQLVGWGAGAKSACLVAVPLNRSALQALEPFAGRAVGGIQLQHLAVGG
jgi:hypothetical protein